MPPRPISSNITYAPIDGPSDIAWAIPDLPGPDLSSFSLAGPSDETTGCCGLIVTALAAWRSQSVQRRALVLLPGALCSSLPQLVQTKLIQVPQGDFVQENENEAGPTLNDSRDIIGGNV